MFGFSKQTKVKSPPPPVGGTRRRHPRVDALGRVFASLGGGQEGSVINISLCGLLLRVKRGLTPGSSYFIKLLFGSKVAVVEARVIRLLTRNDDYLAGMEFIRLSNQDREAIQSFIGPV
jgi:hypothetical protein